ncbi:hypothetical protein DPEC_G00210410 [Dallia pectoralis]|uniref:Uncharacterized protein n=1 Tax=Dallia pectoralis TaxID=75939 RepID=A0ACC2G673_DALPE|nr:hypothetical protein DPEC_G00210410 [Dallia pectoralis]
MSIVFPVTRPPLILSVIRESSSCQRWLQLLTVCPSGCPQANAEANGIMAAMLCTLKTHSAWARGLRVAPQTTSNTKRTRVAVAPVRCSRGAVSSNKDPSGAT